MKLPYIGMIMAKLRHAMPAQDEDKDACKQVQIMLYLSVNMLNSFYCGKI